MNFEKKNFLVSGDVTSTWKSWSCVITIPTSWVWFFSEWSVVVQSVFSVEWILGVLWHHFHDTKINIIEHPSVSGSPGPGRRLTFGSSWSFHRACLPTSWLRLVKQRLFWRSFLWWFVKSSIACKLIRSSSSGSCIRTRRFPSMSYPTSMDHRKVDRSSGSSCNEVHPTWSFRLLKLPFVVFWWWSFCFHHWSWSYPKLKCRIRDPRTAAVIFLTSGEFWVFALEVGGDSGGKDGGWEKLHIWII